jgi:hypothetical protein
MIQNIWKQNICTIHIKNSLFTDPIDKIKYKNVGIIKIKNKKYIIKKEKFENEGMEYKFFRKYKQRIIKDNFDNFIQIPIEYKKCFETNENIYLFKKLEGDINRSFIKSLSKKNSENILGQLLLIFYYINHKLKIYHNDIFSLRDTLKLNNLMYSKSKNIDKIDIDDMSINILQYYVTIIDFEYFSKKKGYKINYFYVIFSNLLNYKFIFKSELFLLFIAYVFNSTDKFNFFYIKYSYIYFLDKSISNNIKDFDKSIFLNYKLIFNYQHYVNI